MKSTLTTLLVVMVIASSTAQDALTTGNRIIGGGVSFAHKDSENESLSNGYYGGFPSNSIYPPGWRPYYQDNTVQESSFSFSPYYGRFYDDLKMIGLRMSISGSNNEISYEEDFAEWGTEASNKSFSIGAFVRRYFPASDKFGVFFQSGIDLTRSITTNEYRYIYLEDNFPNERSELEYKSLGASIDAELGIYFFILPQLSIETNLVRFFVAYDNLKIKGDQINIEEREGDSSEVNLNLVNEFSLDKIFTLNFFF